ncbi:hypothetical protein GCM10010372_31060 [Streptomyces tauricus]|uniref:hypothetical protein n=1 Tax=Streptomyces tauricus TaxID=68274 RepID=UPI001672306A|nr:hypothetical protein [Streptomyces tauricus]GHA28957.1 hypothetical protein GCM10010372_31060 [Streptomyces tauricus]
MSEPIRDTETAVRELGAIPVPGGDATPLTPEQRAKLSEQLGDAKPATTGLLLGFGDAVRNRCEHEHPTWEDLYCMNLSSYMGERMAPVLRRLLDAEAEIERLSELEAAPTAVYRAEHPDSGIVLGHYGTEAAARAHCEAMSRRDIPGAALDWIEDDEDRVAELVAAFGEDERPTGYIVTALELDSEYDPEAAE